MSLGHRQAPRVLVVAALSTAIGPVGLATTDVLAAPPINRDYQGPPAAPVPQPTPDEPSPGPRPSPPTETTPPAETPPAETPPAETPPAETPPADAPPVESPPVEGGVAEDAAESGDEGFDGFDVVDLTEDPEALAEEMKVETKEVKGAKGTVEGTVKDSVTGQPMIGAYVEAIGTKYKTKTDFDGNYDLELPPGKYDIRIRYDTSEPRRISGVVIADGKTETVNSELRPLAGAGQTVVVQAEMNRESEGARLLQRKESAGARDIMSRDEISKSGGGSTAAVAKRIVGVTLVGGRYVFVRGLGHRYGNTFFDRARVPSPEPELRTVPLDIFPSGALSAINVQKTFTPDVPGDFAGGSVQLESREVPDELTFEVKAEVGGNTATTFRGFATNGPFPAYDAFGFGNLPRALPGVLPDDAPASRLELDDNFQRRFTDEKMEEFGEAMYTDTRVRRAKIAPPNWGLKTAVGYGFKPTNQGKLGFLAAAEYKNKHQTERRLIRQFGLGANDELNTSTPLVDYNGFKTSNTVNWSTIGLIKYDIDKKNRVTATAFYSREAEDETRELRGVAPNVSGDAPVTNTRLRYIMRSILLTKLGGRHKIEKARNLTIDWFGSFAQARRDDPAIRDMFFTDADQDGTYRFDTGNEAGKQLFLDLLDNTESGALDLTLPFEQWGQLDSKIKIGAWVEGKQRQFGVRRFSFNVANGLGGDVPDGTGNIISDRTIGAGTPAGSGGTQPFFLQENTRAIDNYDATQEIYAGYAMLELPFVRWFKIAGGARFEANNIDVQPFDLFTGDQDPDRAAQLRDRDILPSVGLIFPVTEKQNIRLVGTRTLARPEFRELAPFTFTDFVGGADVTGNPELVSTKIWNADARWEWFPSASEVIAASVFYKYFDEPIERVVLPRVPLLMGFRNADAAHNIGVELEGRKNLEFIWKALKDFTLGANFTYVYSRVRLRPPCDPMATDCTMDTLADVSTSRERPLQDQAPYVVNTFLDYGNERVGATVRLLYRVEGPQIEQVGGLGLPDIYELPTHDLHLVYSQELHAGFSMSVTVENMLNWPLRWTQDDIIVERYRKGTSFSLGLGYRY